MALFCWAIIATEPHRRATYVAGCLGKGFTEKQCRFLYAEREQDDIDTLTALSLSAAALATAASRPVGLGGARIIP